MFHLELNNGTGFVSFYFNQYAGSSNITYTIENDIFIMVCETALTAPDLILRNRFNFSIVNDGEIYLVLDGYSDYMCLKKVS